MKQLFIGIMKLWKMEMMRVRFSGIRSFTKIFIILSNIIFIGFDKANAQIQAPDLICVKNDTLFWNAPANNCGAFRGYLVFASQNENGPYSLLSTITNPNQTSFFHANAGAGQWFYYLQSDFDCPGQTALTSDTLDNRIPEAGLIRYVTVRGDDVEIGWEVSVSPEVFAYIISKSTPAGTAIIDTVFGGTTYLDTTATPGERPETYFVVAIDRCGNNSLIPPPHTTMLLEGMGASACDRTVSLEWNLYRNWSKPIQKHEIWVSENGGAPRVAGEAANNATSFTFQDANAGINYCFTVRAIESESGNIASSNEVCLTLDVIPAVTELILTNATITPDNNVSLTWLWNDNAAIDNSEVLRAQGSANFTAISSGVPTQPLSRNNSFLDEDVNPSGQPVSYQIQTTDACNVRVQSNVVSTIFLEATSQGTPAENLLRWTEYRNEYITDIVYELYRQPSNGSPLLIATYTDGTFEHTDNVDINSPDERGACYFALAKADLTLPDGKTLTVESRSNVACVTQELKLYIPNAFAPNGVNQEFKPIMPFGQPTEYSMVIYNRWGEKVFETQNINDGWNGKIANNNMPQGGYLYYIRLTTAEGTTAEYAGMVTLIR